MRLAAFLSAVCLSVANLYAGPETIQTEARVKAMFLFNFALFTQWPATEKKLTFCTLGEDKIAEELGSVARGRNIADRPVAARPSTSPKQLAECNVIYIGRSERNRIPQIARGIQGKSVLLVSEYPDDGKEGATINFFLEESKMRFAVNLDAAGNAGVVLRSNLLRLARITSEKK